MGKALASAPPIIGTDISSQLDVVTEVPNPAFIDLRAICDICCLLYWSWRFLFFSLGTCFYVLGCNGSERQRPSSCYECL